MKRVGAVDCGTNSIRLLIADIDDDGKSLQHITRQMQIVRLGHGVDATKRIAPESMERTLKAAREYAAACSEAGCESVRFVATSASRDAQNADEFIAGVQEAFAAFGTGPEVVSGHEEASLSFTGATGDLRADGAAAPYLVLDIGGGSTEFVRGDGDVEQSHSVNMGCVRLTERHLAGDPPTEAQVEAALDNIHAGIDEAAQDVDFTGISTLVGLAGSVTTITAHALNLSEYDSERIHGVTLPVEDVLAACTDLVQRDREQRAELGFMHPGRVDVIGAGALVWRSVIERLVRDSGITHVRTSERDILDGIALSQA